LYEEIDVNIILGAQSEGVCIKEYVIDLPDDDEINTNVPVKCISIK
jgi:hypothetical protein